jgi:hypothetical protein
MSRRILILDDPADAGPGAGEAGGPITVESAAGQGGCFRVALPAVST